jgi:hypothetical protein
VGKQFTEGTKRKDLKKDRKTDLGVEGSRYPVLYTCFVS